MSNPKTKFHPGDRVLERDSPKEVWVVQSVQEGLPARVTAMCGGAKWIANEDAFVAAPDDWVEPPLPPVGRAFAVEGYAAWLAAAKADDADPAYRAELADWDFRYKQWWVERRLPFVATIRSVEASL